MLGASPYYRQDTIMDFTQLSADLESQPITGYLPDGRHINIPLISHIEDNLFVGGHLNVNVEDFFSHIFSLYKWEKYTHGHDTVTVARTMYDSHSMPVDVETVEELSDDVVAALEAGGNVLVHCQAGINRSNLVAARVLMKWKGLSADEAIRLLRLKRSDLVLANRAFEQYLRNLDHDS